MIVGAFAPTVRVAAVPAPDETPVVAAPLAGTALAAVVFAAWELGEAVLPLNPSAPTAERERLLARLRPTHLHDGDGRRRVPGGVPAPADTVAIIVTSGTTGDPKGVELTRAGMDVMGHGYSAGLDAGPDDRWLACLPLHHVASLGVLARRVRHRCSVHRARRLRSRSRSARTRAPRGRRSFRSFPLRCAACSTRARRSTSTDA